MSYHGTLRSPLLQQPALFSLSHSHHSGYEFYLDISSSGDAETWRTLYDATWVDFGTRMVSLDFTVYNPSIDIHPQTS